MITASQKFFRNILALSALYLTVYLVILPQNCLSAAKSGIELCIRTIIPSLFPFFVCSGILSGSDLSIMCGRFLSIFMRPLFRLPGAGAMTFLLGAVSGYPVGAASATDLYANGQCTKTEAERLTAFCNNSSPLFIIGVVGTGFLGSPKIGYFLYASHILSAILVGILFRFYGSTTASDARTLPAAEFEHTKKAALFSLGGIIDSAVFSTLKICGFIIFFSVFTEAIPDGFLKPYVCSLIEISGGLNLFTRIFSAYSLPLTSFFLGFSGLSIILQIFSIISPKGLSSKPLIVGKLLQGVISFIITLILTKIIPFSQPASVFLQTNFLENFSPTDLILSAILSTFFVFMVLKGMIRISRSFSRQ